MTENQFFFREEYTIEEMESRIRAGEFTIDNAPVYEILDDTQLTPDEAEDAGKEEILNILGDDLSNEDYYEFIEEMFVRYGHEGDRFNQQLFRLPPNHDLNNLRDSLERFEGGPLGQPFDSILSQPLYLNEIKEEDSNIDLRFNTSVDMEEYESEEEIPIQVIDEEGKRVDEIPEDNAVRIPTRSRIEARIYPNQKMISISNSEIPVRLQKEIFTVVLSIITDSSTDTEDLIEVDDE